MLKKVVVGFGLLVFASPIVASAATLIASPASGTAPLTVTLTANTGSGCNGGNFKLIYGDTTSQDTPIPADSCNPVISRSHTYAAAGTYTVELIDTIASNTVMASTTIIVSSNPILCPAGQHSSGGGCVPDTANGCPALSRNLTRGLSGNDVTALQTFLSSRGFLAAEFITGFYGERTEKAVQQFQSQNELVSSGTPATTGWGVVGPATRAVIARICGGWSGTEILHVTPKSGPKPLNVTFAGVVPNVGNTKLLLEFGDELAQLITPQGSTTPAQLGFSVAHTYTVDGLYTATLKRINANCDVDEVQCIHSSGQPLGSVPVRVGNGGVSLSIGSPGAGLVVAQGQVLRLSWTATGTPSDVASAFWLINQNGQSLGRIVDQKPLTGTYDWTVPSRCSSANGCSNPSDPSVQHVEPGQYRVVGKLYSPASAHPSGDLTPPSAGLEYLAAATSSAFTVSTGIPVDNGTACAKLTYNLGRGNTDAGQGGDVSRLQTFLVALGLLDRENVSGFFGPLTEAAVQKYQIARGLVTSGTPSTTGFGAVGPKTRAAMAKNCDGGGSTLEDLKATPATGKAPLAVTITGSLDLTCSNGDFYLVYGDGDEHQVGANSCHLSISKTHTFTSAGTFEVKLVERTDACGAGVDLPGCTKEKVHAKVSVVVSAATTGTTNTTPVTIMCKHVITSWCTSRTVGDDSEEICSSSNNGGTPSEQETYCWPGGVTDPSSYNGCPSGTHLCSNNTCALEQAYCGTPVTGRPYGWQ